MRSAHTLWLETTRALCMHVLKTIWVLAHNLQLKKWAVRGSHAIVSSSVGPEYYVSIMSFVDKAQLEPGCTILLHNKARTAVDLSLPCYSDARS